jgi:hypothetical protein
MLSICVCLGSATAQELEIGESHVYSVEQARLVGDQIGIDWNTSPFVGVRQFRYGMEVELEHGMVDPQTNVTYDDPIMTAKIALAHLNERPDYYFWLAIMEALPNPPFFRLPFLEH